MNQSQRDHAVSRVKAIRDVHIDALKRKHTKPAERLSATERADLLRTGKVKLRPHIRSIQGYTDVIEAFDFAAHETEEQESPKLSGLLEAERSKASKIIDQIMLGEGSEALKLIANYESGK